MQPKVKIEGTLEAQLVDTLDLELVKDLTRGTEFWFKYIEEIQNPIDEF